MEDGQKNLQEACVKAGTRGPSQSPGNAKLDKIKSMAEAVAATSSSPGAAASGDAGNLAILQAIGVLSDKMGNMALKSDLEEPSSIRLWTQSRISPTISTPAWPTSRTSLLQPRPFLFLTPSFKERRLAFVGWPDGVSEDTMIQDMEKFLKTHVSSFRPVDCGSESTGPYNNQKVSKGSWVEFCSPDLAE
ncbi:unnamed protein product [Prorocentrum cordatum]|uniref:Uncharacterized protein n=1 Tax=Prorocentrum cordatum TaxID=2364126 RepID=A0ABN9PI61_9DINO|nr:unnamed protein product [Polarella glacialis]